MKLNLLSKYRTLLMGVAILWVMFYHSHVYVGSSKFLEFFKRIGYGGVDIFILVSGFGVYFSISKDNCIRNFYKKRVLRIFPYYYPIVLIVTIIAIKLGIWNSDSLFYNLTTLGYWRNVGLDKIYDWYIPALLFLYLLTPLYYKFFKINKTATTLCAISAAYIFSYSTYGTYEYLYNLTFRIPHYVIGFWLADFLIKNKEYEFNKFTIILFAISLIVGVSILYYLYFYTPYFEIYGNYVSPFILITVPLCMFLCYFFSLFKSYKFPILTFLGIHSLTLFIFHEKILFLCHIILPSNIENVCAFILTFILAYVWQKLVDNIINKITITKKKTFQ